jgi:DNA-binding CsgD family transcriptional regulator
VSEQKSGVKIVFNLYILRKRLELLKEQDYTYERIAREAGIHPNTVYNLAANRSKRIDISTVKSLLNYFRRQGMQIGIQDLILVTEEEN